MLFNSWSFILFAIVVFLIYYLPFLKKVQVEILVVSSLIFYSFSNPMLVLLLIISALINTLASYYVVYAPKRYKKCIATAGVSLNLLILIFFKYSPLIAVSFLNTEDGLGNFLLHVPLPIGISFYTFKGISLVVDVFTEKHFDHVEKVIALPQKKAHRKEGWEKEEKAGCLKKIVLKTMYVFAYECKS